MPFAVLGSFVQLYSSSLAVHTLTASTGAHALCICVCVIVINIIVIKLLK